MDNDGDLDVLVATAEVSNEFYISRLSTISKPFLVLLKSGAFYEDDSNADSRDIELGDIDGDGDLDVFIVNYGTRNVFYTNNGNGGLIEEVDSVFGLHAPDSQSVALELLDTDGDATIDRIRVTNDDGEANLEYQNAVRGGVGNLISVYSPFTNPGAILTKDFEIM